MHVGLTSVRALGAALFAACLAVVTASVASAQTGQSYAEAVAQSAFGNVTSQSFGGELGIAVTTRAQLFVDAGQTRDTSAADLGAGAQRVAGYLSQAHSGVAYRTKQPVTFALAGLRYIVPIDSKLQPYVLGGGGAGRVSRDVTFSVSGTDVTGNLSQYGVALGPDLQGTDTKAMATVGAGVMWPLSGRLIVDFQYRYGRVFTSEGISLHRVGGGVGVRF